MSKANAKGAEGLQPERVQLLVRIPKVLHRTLKHAAVDRDTTLNDLVTTAIEQWSADELGAPTIPGNMPRISRKKKNK
jgi:predicted HicB family RNase H-like nuclease